MTKDLSTGKINSLAELEARVQQQFEAVPFDHPTLEYADIEFWVSMLSNGEREHINLVARIGTVDGSGSVFNRLTVAYGLVTPEFLPALPPNSTRAAREARAIRIADKLLAYPDNFIGPIATEVWRLTNAYIEGREGGAESSPFSKRASGSPSGSSTDSTSTPISLRDGVKHA